MHKTLPILTVTAALLAACAAPGGDPIPPDPPGTEYVTYLGTRYPVLRVPDEPTPDLTANIITLPDGGRAVAPDAPFVTTGPAIRVSNVAARPTATDVLATYCARRGMAVSPGWRDVVVRFDDTTADHVFYMDC
jgi:hypothetical protein